MPWLSSPWKPVCVPHNLSGSSSLSSRLLGSDSRDPQPSREPCVRNPIQGYGTPFTLEPSLSAWNPSPSAMEIPQGAIGPPPNAWDAPRGLWDPHWDLGPHRVLWDTHRVSWTPHPVPLDAHILPWEAHPGA